MLDAICRPPVWVWAIVMTLVVTTAVPAEAASQAPGSPAPTQPPAAPVVVPAYRQATHIAILTIDGEIDHMTEVSLERRMTKAVADGADAVVLKINTPGGEMGAMLDICNLVKDRNVTPANIVAWVNPQAYSAGTVISLACREIVITPGGTFGDAAPIQIHPIKGLVPLPATERAKLESPIRDALIDSARRNHYDEKLVQTFIRLGDGLWMLENISTGEAVFVDLAEYRAVFGEEPSKVTTAYTAAKRARTAVTPWFDTTIPRQSDNTGVNKLTPQQQLEYAQSLPPTRSALTAADRGQWRLVAQVVDNATLLTVKSDEALFYGLAKQVVADNTELKAYFGAQTIRQYDESWSEELVRFLVNPFVRGILIVIFLLCLFMELAVPGFGMFGIASVITLLLIVGAPALADMAHWWSILLIIVGLLLVLAELFVIPGFGITGVAGAACLLVGLISTFISGDVTSIEGQNQLWTGVMTTLTSMFAAGVGMWFISRQLPSLPLFNRMILNTSLSDGASDGAGSSLLQAMGPARPTLQVGDTGTAITDLRPAGKASIGNRVLDVKSAGDFLHKGTPVRVVDVGRFTIEVEEIRT